MCYFFKVISFPSFFCRNNRPLLWHRLTTGHLEGKHFPNQPSQEKINPRTIFRALLGKWSTRGKQLIPGGRASSEQGREETGGSGWVNVPFVAGKYFTSLYSLFNTVSEWMSEWNTSLCVWLSWVIYNRLYLERQPFSILTWVKGYPPIRCPLVILAWDVWKCSIYNPIWSLSFSYHLILSRALILPDIFISLQK